MAAILLGTLVTNSLFMLRLRRLGLLRNTLVLLACWLCTLLAQLGAIFVVANLIIFIDRDERILWTLFLGRV